MRLILALIALSMLSAADAFAGIEAIPVTSVPTLSEWGMIVAAAALMLAGVLFSIYRRRAAKA
ncbi:MAG TPA: IPTL-CTERM sorting domain-containing protein [Thermodesulfobacteriota bacterium]|nr:IPTL-CTERM sorting domain-containing protein [Thermodesulfobacteriota bacterium]